MGKMRTARDGSGGEMAIFAKKCDPGGPEGDSRKAKTAADEVVRNDRSGLLADAASGWCAIYLEACAT